MESTDIFGPNNYFGDTNSLKLMPLDKKSFKSFSDFDMFGSYNSENDEDYSYNEDLNQNWRKVCFLLLFHPFYSIVQEGLRRC